MGDIKWVPFTKYQLKVQEYVTFNSKMTMKMKRVSKTTKYKFNIKKIVSKVYDLPVFAWGS